MFNQDEAARREEERLMRHCRGGSRPAPRPVCPSLSCFGSSILSPFTTPFFAFAQKVVHHETPGTASFPHNTAQRPAQPSYAPRPAPAAALQRASPAPAPHTVPPPVNRAEVGLLLFFYL